MQVLAFLPHFASAIKILAAMNTFFCDRFPNFFIVKSSKPKRK